MYDLDSPGVQKFNDRDEITLSRAGEHWAVNRVPVVEDVAPKHRVNAAVSGGSAGDQYLHGVRIMLFTIIVEEGKRSIFAIEEGFVSSNSGRLYGAHQVLLVYVGVCYKSRIQARAVCTGVKQEPHGPADGQAW